MSDDRVDWTGGIPKCHLRDHFNTIVNAGQGEVLELLGWLEDDFDLDRFQVDEDFDVYQRGGGIRKTVVGKIMDGTIVGEFPHLFETPRRFVFLKLKIVQVQVDRDLRAV